MRMTRSSLRRSVPIAVFLMVTVASGFCAQKKSLPQTKTSGSNDLSCIYKTILPALREKSGVPPMLPSRIDLLDCSTFANLIAVDNSGYHIVLAATTDCEGQHVCAYGSVEGSKTPIRLGSDGVPVRLNHGSSARYFATQCYAYCDEAYITWAEKGFYYSVGLKAGSKQQLISAANSVFSPK